VVSHHALATVAMLALRNHPWSKGRQPMPQDIVRLANNVHSIEHPFVGDEHDALMLLVRICHQQWPFQEPMWYFIPRHLLLYTNSSVSSPAIDPQERFLHTVGLTIREFIVIGMLMYASALQNHTFDRAFLEHTSDDLLRPYVVADKIDAFLSVAGADPATFRQLCLDEERECPTAYYVFQCHAWLCIGSQGVCTTICWSTSVAGTATHFWSGSATHLKHTAACCYGMLLANDAYFRNLTMASHNGLGQTGQ